MFKYQFFSYFISAYTVVLGFIIGWFIANIRQEKRLLKTLSNPKEQ